MAGDSAAKTTLQSDSEGYTRLHITPLDADLLKVVVPAAVLPQARNISYHNLETLPEKRYGFVELPLADADKLRKKLNGATLRGTKVRIDQARPESIHEPNGGAMADENKVKKPKKEKKSKLKESEKFKKRKWEGEEVEGAVIQDRKIKRGWTVTESDKIQEKRRDRNKKGKDADGKKEKKLKKREVKSKYTDAPECLFKQTLPEPPSESKKADEEEEDEPKRKKRKGARQVVMHEFEKTHKYPTFLKSSTATTESKPLTFEDGKGWVDEEGNVVESQNITRPSFANVKVGFKQIAKPAPVDDDDTSSSGSSSDSDSDSDEVVKPTAPKKETKSTPVQQADDTTSSSGSSSDDSDDSSDEEPAPKVPVTKTKAAAPAALKTNAPLADDSDGTSSSGSSSENESDSNESPVKQKPKRLQVDTQTPTSPATAAKNDSARPKSSGSAASLTIQIPPVTPAATKVHPLEALYKRPAGTEAEPDAGFSFFGNNDDIEEDLDEAAAPSSQVPMTPFSKQDFEVRNIRSAAPTPDTAHPSRSYNLWPRLGEDDIAEEDEEDEEGEDAGEDTTMTDATTPGASADKSSSKSEFQNWFWEHRGDLNRSWKKRRKTASKEKRNRENRARAARAI
ncbi:hypothetical protein PFICI_14323 [Pestalotiopsis fici W106-1]|uniref:Uncharacterized protein n=1 Tax=Pestalotiopsis fici (strain W106-1 / CGMCC3.15140) TaxID=1229662 RepID=W3WMS3_PESFW|nr:uncharacterized protein PFICI_14323 [Pestalotiopsis fici W106-1]ETS74457.1 hypothetical protein PFICI_14323 [Pestalotiopsis fici W106-1]